jgi:anaerobic magnesium-protoporphyrin IX monomethyl ester cyclase
VKKAITIVPASAYQPRTAPLGPLYIAAVLERAGYRIDFRDYAVSSYWDLDTRGFLSELNDCADVVGLSCTSDLLPFVIGAAKELKLRHPEKTVILGGPGPTGVAREIIEAFPYIDIVVVGEGETTIVEVMDCLTNGGRGDLRLVGGICFRDGEEVIETPERERIRDLDRLPLPLYECISVEDFPLINIVFSRGCPYKCTFCDVAPVWKYRNYRRSIDSVISELKYLTKKYGVRNFEFTDETFVLKPNETMTFCERLSKEELGIEWACSGRINLSAEGLLSRMAASGCKALFYGVESGSDGVLQNVRKDFSTDQVLDVIGKTLKHMHAVASFIWGFPHETEDDFLKTLLLMVYLSQIGVDTRLSRLTPFALSPLYKEYRDRLIDVEETYALSRGDPFRSRPYRSDIRELISAFPGVFPEFRWFPADRLAEKSMLVESLFNHWNRTEWPMG